MTKPAANSIEGKAEPYMKRIESLKGDLESERSKYMNACKPIHEDIRDIYTEAKTAGVSAKALKGLVKFRELEKRQDAIADDFDEDNGAIYEVLIEALGPLGKAAAKAAGHPAGDDDKDLRSTAQKQTDKERADEEALGRVGRGKSEAADSLAKTH